MKPDLKSKIKHCLKQRKQAACGSIAFVIQEPSDDVREALIELVADGEVIEEAFCYRLVPGHSPDPEAA